MNRISSRWTKAQKRLFPIFWFGTIAVVVISMIASQASSNPAPLPVVLGPIAMGIFGYFIMKKFIWDLLDEVYDCGDHLVVRNAGQEDTIFLTNVKNVSYSILQNPPRVTLSLREPCRFGTEISYIPPIKPFRPFFKDPSVADLIDRIDQARR